MWHKRRISDHESSPHPINNNNSTDVPTPHTQHTAVGLYTPKMSSGVTHSIREHLHFTDEKRWKEFSTRRLELIDKFNLSSKKASEQDDSIRHIANLLREEYGYPQDTLLDFDKLVRAAIQSVRRNRKRSSRARVSHDRFIVYDEMGRAVPLAAGLANPSSLTGKQLAQEQTEMLPHQQQLAHHHHHHNQNQNQHSLHHSHPNSSSSSNSISNSSSNSTTNLQSYGMGLNLNMGMPSNGDSSSALSMSAPMSMPTSGAPTPSLFQQSGLSHPMITSSLLSSSLGPPQVLQNTLNNHITTHSNTSPLNNNTGGAVNVTDPPVDTRVVINSLLSTNATTTNTTSTPATSISTSPNTNTQLPSIKSLTNASIPSSSSSNTVSGNGKVEISPQTKQKLLNFIQKSKSCLLLSNNDTSIHEDNLHNLGKSVTSASISFILERFFNDISSDSINYLSHKLQNVSTLSKVLKALGFFSTDVLILTDSQASNLLCKLIGCCVKDFGFDGVSYTLGEIFHEIILNEYPLVATQVTKITPESLFTPMLPIPPKEADTEVMKDVQLRYGSRTLDFKFSPLSAAPPTYLELVENGKVAFGIQEKNIRLRHAGRDLSEGEISRLFKSLDMSSLRKLEIELYEVGNADMMKFTPLL